MSYICWYVDTFIFSLQSYAVREFFQKKVWIGCHLRFEKDDEDEDEDNEEDKGGHWVLVVSTAVHLVRLVCTLMVWMVLLNILWFSHTKGCITFNWHMTDMLSLLTAWLVQKHRPRSIFRPNGYFHDVCLSLSLVFSHKSITCHKFIQLYIADLIHKRSICCFSQWFEWWRIKSRFHNHIIRRKMTDGLKIERGHS